MRASEMKRGTLVRAAIAAVKAGVLLLSWLGSAALAATLAAAGYLAVSVVIAVALVRVAAQVVVAQGGTTRRAGAGWTAFRVLLDAVTLVGTGVLVIVGVLIAAAALSSPVLWSGLPGVLAVITGVHAGALVARSMSRSGAKAQRQRVAQKVKQKLA